MLDLATNQLKLPLCVAVASIGSRGAVGRNAWERPSHTFFMFYFKMSFKLFQNG